MKAAVYDHHGPPEVLRCADVAEPRVGPEDVLIEVRAISVEGGDLINRRTTPPPAPGHVVGYAASGRIVATGPAVTHRAVGQRVTSFGFDGSHAARRVVPARQTWLVPDGVHWAAAAALPISFGTAHHCLFARGALRAGETVFIQAAAGGVGLAAIQLAKRAGATVIASSSGPDRLQRLVALGADLAIDRRTEDVAGAVLDRTEGEGVAVVVDPVGSTLQASLSVLADGGRLVFVGNAGGGRLEADLWPALQANQSLLGVFMGSRFLDPAVFATVDDMLADVAEGTLTVVVDRAFALADAPAAHRHAEESSPFGRVVLVPE
ncbi:quinone oxidoreductase family protein [Rubrimonas cliftonensis]|uniref:NADPH:quinone reductase n=1 Tax=Rubrimonas cliftonensis TaxID=89524 RepID=A0A1H4FRW3_9RHOB|nr:zinc-binding dehydrogenase [Rubrimonas cliftonensis]SEB00089.1 NADPH:quinone reductase [Rubrimonas cliftonensis]